MAEPVELPQFTGSPEDVALAVRAWAAGVACTGVRPTRVRSVDLSAVGASGGHAGHLRLGGDRAWLVAPTATPTTTAGGTGRGRPRGRGRCRRAPRCAAGWWSGPPAGSRPPASVDRDGFLKDPDWRSRHGGVWWRGEVAGCAVGRRVVVAGAGAEAALLAAAVDEALDRAVAAGRWPRDLQVRVSCADREAGWNDAPELVVLSPAVRARLLRVGDVAAVALGLACRQSSRRPPPSRGSGCPRRTRRSWRRIRSCCRSGSGG